VPRHIISQKERTSWRGQKVDVEIWGEHESVYRRLLVCRDCAAWIPPESDRRQRGYCQILERQTGRAASCKKFCAEDLKLFSFVLDTLWIDGRIGRTFMDGKYKYFALKEK
jgi:hypothetical protein